MPESEPPLRLGSRQRWGETNCGYGVDQPACENPAVWHLLWLDSNNVSATCEQHLAFINSRQHPEYDRHTFGPNCNMPGVLWQFPFEDENEGYCVFPANDDASAMQAWETVAAEANPASAR